MTETSGSGAEGQSGKSSRIAVPLREQLRAEWVGVCKLLPRLLLLTDRAFPMESCTSVLFQLLHRGLAHTVT